MNKIIILFGLILLIVTKQIFSQSQTILDSSYNKFIPIIAISDTNAFAHYSTGMQRVNLVTPLSIQNINLYFSYKIRIKTNVIRSPKWAKGNKGIKVGRKANAIIQSLSIKTNDLEPIYLNDAWGSCSLNAGILFFNKRGRNCRVSTSASSLMKLSKGGIITMEALIEPYFYGSISTRLNIRLQISMN